MRSRAQSVSIDQERKRMFRQHLLAHACAGFLLLEATRDQIAIFSQQVMRAFLLLEELPERAEGLV